MRVLDLFCGAGGCTKGYQLAGFHVVGVDIHDQPNYCGDEFFVGDALDALGAWWECGPFDAIHASPPCPAHSSLTGWGASRAVNEPAVDLIPETRKLLISIGLPYVIENVPGARSSLINPVQICGQSLGLRVRRHRLFETNWPLMAPGCHHPGPPVIVVSGSIGRKVFDPRRKAIAPSLVEAIEVMGMPWAKTAREVTNAIPPAYTELIGHQLVQYLAGVPA